MSNEKTKKQTKNVPEKKEKPERGKNKAAEREGDGIWAFLIPALLIALAVFIAVCLVAQGFAGGFADNGEIPEKLNGGLNNYAGQANSYPLGVFGYGIMWFFSALFGSLAGLVCAQVQRHSEERRGDRKIHFGDLHHDRLFGVHPGRYAQLDR